MDKLKKKKLIFAKTFNFDTSQMLSQRLKFVLHLFKLIYTSFFYIKNELTYVALSR